MDWGEEKDSATRDGSFRSAAGPETTMNEPDADGARTDAQYREVELEDDRLVVYDASNPNAWLASDLAVRIAP